MKNINPLVKAARDKKIAHPGQLDKFKRQDWITYAQNINVQDQEAVSFFNGACWLNEHFHRVEITRKQFSLLGDFPLDYRELVRAHIAGANYAFWLVNSEQQLFMASIKNPSVEQLTISKSSMVGNSDPSGVNQVMMFRLDSLRNPLWELFHFKDKMQILFPNDRTTKLPPRDFFTIEMKMSQYYYGFSLLWQELLYGEAIFYYQPGKVFFILRHPYYHRMKCIAEYRHEHRQNTDVLQTYVTIQKTPFIQKFSGYLSYNSNGSLAIKSWDDLSESSKQVARFYTLAPFHQLDEYLMPLLVKQQTNSSVNGILQTVIDLWVQFAVLSEQINTFIKSNHKITEWSNLLELAPQFYRTNLIALLYQCTGYVESQVEDALNLLTWVGAKPQDDLWAQPLIRIDEKIIFPISAFLTAGISRNVDFWMSKLDDKDTQRGQMFEQYLTSLFKRCQNENAVMREHLRYTSNIKPFYNGITEEIDATFSFGNLLIIVEARSRKKPITPLDYENDLNDSNGLIKKARQVARKADFIRCNLKEFCHKYYPHLLEQTNVKVIPLVIVNGQFHAGYPLNTIPIIDTSLLLHFLKDGEIRLMYDQIKKKHQYSLPLWSTIEEAQTRFEKYIRKPVLIEVYESLCKETEIRSKNLGEGCDDVVTLTFEMQVDEFEKFIDVIKRNYPNKLIKYF